jgi:hypothetical protein
MSSTVDFVGELSNELRTWPGVAIGRRLDGALVISYKRSRLGVIYPDRGLAELPFAGAERDALIEEGDAEPAVATPESTGVDHPIRGAGDVTAVLDLFDRRYREVRGDEGPYGVQDPTL